MIQRRQKRTAYQERARVVGYVGRYRNSDVKTGVAGIWRSQCCPGFDSNGLGHKIRDR